MIPSKEIGASKFLSKTITQWMIVRNQSRLPHGFCFSSRNQKDRVVDSLMRWASNLWTMWTEWTEKSGEKIITLLINGNDICSENF